MTAPIVAAPASPAARAAAAPLGGLCSPPGSSPPWSTRIAYAGPALALAVVGVPLYVFIPKFYSDVVGVPIAVLGTILAAVRLFDAVLDPPIGWLSDQTRTRMGRRRPWLLVGVVPLALCIVALLVPPALDPAAATLWFAIAIFAVFLFWTAVTVPYEALGPELCFDHHDRTALLGLRDGALLLGTVVAVSSPFWIGSFRTSSTTTSFSPVRGGRGSTSASGRSRASWPAPSASARRSQHSASRATCPTASSRRKS